MTKHSSIGASSMHRWSQCPGSVRQCEGIESTSSVYADEGTKAHEYAAEWLKTGREPHITDADMLAAVRVYVEWVHEHMRPPMYGEGDVFFVEHKFDLSQVHPGAFGTGDVVIWKPSRRHLIVVDFKYGAGVYVSPTGNPQLKYYGLGCLVDPPDPSITGVETVELVIIQPRYETAEGPIRSHAMDVFDLHDFRTELKDYAEATEKPDAPLVPGEHCRFCPAARSCPGLQAKTQEIAKLEFRSDLTYDPAKLKLALDSIPALKAFIKSVDEFAYAEAEAGRCVPGYKLVEKRPTRQWKNVEEAEAALEKLGITPSVLYEPRTLRSPAALEKEGIKEAVFKDLVERVSSGHTLAPESDKRPAVKPSAKEEFTVVEATAAVIEDPFS